MIQKIVQTNTTQRIYKTYLKQIYIFVDKMYQINIHIYMYLYKIKYTRHTSLLLFQLAVSLNHLCTCVSNDRKSLETQVQKCVIETESRKNGS